MGEIKSADYSVFITRDIAKEINTFFQANKDVYSKLFILVDENTFKDCYPPLVEKIPAFKDAELIEIESGEENKNIDVCVQIWGTLSELGADRKSLFVNLGGGVIGDMGGFIASTFKRGIDFINIPTTLLSQVDASVGGKVGIDLNHLKNEIGVFNNPKAVFVNSSFLSTLDERQLLSGFAEIIKHALIADADYWKKVTRVDLEDLDALDKLIETSVKIKNKVVMLDPQEYGVRKSLNFGHTIGHAIETCSLEEMETDSFLHGESIAIGMICEAYLSYKTCGLPPDQLKEITDFILSRYSALSIDHMNHQHIVELMGHDKKNEKGQLNFSLLSAIGKCEINKKVSSALIFESLTYYTEQLALKE
ncbi:MAG TPA: 3-dehydroquinate synthase [Bacteroidia bacterium]|jgi:3-dehydroquinate synthase|nr:3-dehydroquinate synthase [Bacteroidia bacterium]